MPTSFMVKSLSFRSSSAIPRSRYRDHADGHHADQRPGRVLLVDDHPAVRRVLMDCRMPRAGGVAATREIVQRWPEVAVVAHTAYADETYVREMVAAGARGYVLKDEFLAMVSHELRTPITVVLGMAQTLVGRPDMAATADGQEILQRVVRQGKRLRDMVEQLLQASAFVANRSPVLRAEEVMASSVVAEVVDDWRLAEPDRRVELTLPDQPRSLHGDAEALRMVAGNLVDNAGKHAPPGTPIRVQVSQPAGLTRIEVADQGEGVAAIDRERIFAPFTQLDASTTRRVGGVGLGLFLVDRLVRGMGGQVWVEDDPGGGARFVVELPDLAPV
jgi:two-component system, OmpR family, sensor kinase